MPIEIIASMEDKSGTKGTTSIQVLDATTLAQLNAFAPLWATALNDLTWGVIRSVFALVKVPISTLTDNLGSLTADVEHIGKFQFKTTEGVPVNVNIPCLDEGALGNFASDVLDQTDPSVADFIAAMESGLAVTGGTIVPCDIGGIPIDHVVFAREAFRNSGARK